MLLPLLSHPEFADDTLHIIAEPDFCFREADAVARAEWAKSSISESLILDRLRLLHDEEDAPDEMKGVIAEVYEAQRELVSGGVNKHKRGWEKLIVEDKQFGLQSGSSSDPRKRPASASSESRLEIELRPNEDAVDEASFDCPPRGSAMKESSKTEMGSHWLPDDEKYSKPSSYGLPSNELSDLMDLAAEASRSNCGDFIWCSWNSQHWSEKSKGRMQSPFAGAFLQMVTTRGARHITAQLELHKTPDKHMGNWFRNDVCDLYMKDVPSCTYGACYIFPSIGSYIAHESTTSIGRHLMSHWNRSWNQQGVRPITLGDQDRELCRVTKSGHRQTTKTVKLPLGADKCMWRTLIPNEVPKIHLGIRPIHMRGKQLDDPTDDKRWSTNDGVEVEYKERIGALMGAAPWNTAKQIELDDNSEVKNIKRSKGRKERHIAVQWAHRIFVSRDSNTLADIYGQIPQIVLPPTNTPEFVAHGFHMGHDDVEAVWLATCREKFGPGLELSNQTAIAKGHHEVRLQARQCGMTEPEPLVPIQDSTFFSCNHPLIHDFKRMVLGRKQRNMELVMPPPKLTGPSVSKAAKAGAKPKLRGFTPVIRMPKSQSASSSKPAPKKKPRNQ